MNKTIRLVLLPTLMLSIANAWWGTAHMIVARIAENQLTETNP